MFCREDPPVKKKITKVLSLVPTPKDTRQWPQGAQEEMADTLTKAIHNADRVMIFYARKEDDGSVTTNTAIYARTLEPAPCQVSWLEYLSALNMKMHDWFNRKTI